MKQAENLQVLYLDFDGVLHPDDVWRRRGTGVYLGGRNNVQARRVCVFIQLIEHGFKLLEPNPGRVIPAAGTTATATVGRLPKQD